MTCRALGRRGLTLAIVMLCFSRIVSAQGPTINPDLPVVGNLEGSSLGTTPGADASPFPVGPGADQPILGGRPGASVPRVPSTITRPGGGMGRALPLGIAPPATVAPAEPPPFGSLALPARDEEGPADGLTLDQAIERLVRENLELRSKFFEIPQADADILTASLRANPILYADSQLIPYGNYSEERPGGPVQYDVNITYPVDVTHKRRARTEVAQRAKRVLEAQYQDAVRIQIDNLYTAYIDVLAARETVRFAQASVEGLREVAETTETLKERGVGTAVEVERIRIQSSTAEIGLSDALESLAQTKRGLASLLNLPAPTADAMELRGTLHDLAPPPPPVPQLVEMAMAARPDLIAYRRGVARATADVELARANRFSDVYVLYQPYTFQDNAPFDTKSAHSWALGVTVPLPLYNRNQGNIQRARLNVSQTQTELTTLERQVITEVDLAAREYGLTRVAVGRIEQDLLPSAQRMLATAEQLYRAGESDLIAFLNAKQEYNNVIRQYRDTLVRHRRGMLRLNTVVGRRILP